MRNYRKTAITVEGILTVKIEMWDEHNHGTVYRDNDPIFDGYISGAYKAFDAEVKKLCEAAEACGLAYTVS